MELRVRRVEFFPLADRVRVAAGDTTRATYQLLGPADERRGDDSVRVSAPRVSVRFGTDTAASDIRNAGLRVARDPLIIVDGVIVNRGAAVLTEMDPKGIESIEVIKGELAQAKYGTRASDGVIMIRTRTAPVPPPPPALPAPPPPPPPGR